MKTPLLILSIISSVSFAYELHPNVQNYLNSLEKQAKQDNPNFSSFDYARGESIFTTKHIGKKGKLISCTSCHTTNLNQNGENISTGKLIEPLSPSTNPQRFTKVKEVKKWLRRNFRDVYKREGTAKEKGDVITYIINKK